MAKKLVLPVRELYKYSPYEVKKGLTKHLSILFEDNVVLDMSYREVILLRFILDIYLEIPEIKIVSKHSFTTYYTDGILTSKTINKVFEVILEDTVKHYFKKNINYDTLEWLYKQMYYIVNNIYNNLTYEALDYTNSININDLLEVQLDQTLLNAMKDVYENRGKEETYKTVNRVNNSYNVLDTILRNDKLKNNIVSKGYRSGTINANQVKQVLASRGYVTEVDSNIFTYPIASSFTLGMSDIYDLAIESRSGARSLFLSHKAVQESEYFAREMQIITMIVERLVDGDCGQKDYIDWFVRPKTDVNKADLPNIIGKYYYNEKTKQEEVITINHKHLEGTTIKLRSAINCKLKEPTHVCSKCFGELVYSIPPHSNIGHYCSTTITEKITQSILSTKHLSSSASSGDVHLDVNGEKFFNVKNNAYVFKNNLDTKKTKYKIIVEQFEAFGFKDLYAGIDVYKFNPTRISIINTIVLQVIDAKGKATDYLINIKDNNKRGSFTHEFLDYVTQQGFSLNANDMCVIDLDNWDFKLPIINMPELEYNFLTLAKNVKSLFRKIEIKKDEYRSTDTPESFLQRVFDCINVKLDINIALMEVVVYACTVYSIKDRDYRLGRNSPDRQLMKSQTLIDNRSLGAGYGWEKVIDKILSARSFYNNNKVSHPMDVLVKPDEVLNKEIR